MLAAEKLVLVMWLKWEKNRKERDPENPRDPKCKKFAGGDIWNKKEEGNFRTVCYQFWKKKFFQNVFWSWGKRQVSSLTKGNSFKKTIDEKRKLITELE